MNKARLLLLAACLLPSLGQAATKYWIGPPGGDASTAANWSTTAGSACGVNANTTAPGVADIATFTSDCTSTAFITGAASVAGINIAAGYSGTITQNSGVTITVGATGYVQAGGTFVGGNAAMVVNGPYTLSGGSFTSTSGTLTTNSSGITISGGTFVHNSGSVLVTFAGTVNTGTAVLNNLDINALGNVTVTGTVTIDGNLALSRFVTLSTGTLAVKGNVTAPWTGVITSASAVLLFEGSGDQTASGGGWYPSISINKPSGTLFLQDALNLRGANWTHTAGTVDAGTSAVNFVGNTVITANTTVFNNVSFSNTPNVTVSGTMNIAGYLYNYASTSIAGGAINVGGDLYSGDTTTSGGAYTTTITLNGTGNQSIWTTGGGTFPAITINKPSGTATLTSNVAFGAAEPLTLTAGTLDLAGYALTLASYSQGGGTFSGGAGSITVNTGGNFSLTNGTFTSTSGTLTANGSVTISGGTFNHNSGTVAMTGNAGTLDIGAKELNNLTFNGNANFVVTGTAIVNGNLLLTNATSLTSGTIAVKGDVTTSMTTTVASTIILFNGTGDQSLTASGGARSVGSVTINKASGTLFLTGVIIVPAHWTYTAGTVDAGTSTVSFRANGSTISSGAMTFNNAALQSGGHVVVTGTMKVGGNFDNISTLTLTGGTIQVGGNISTSDASVNGTTLFVLNGTGDQSITQTAGGLFLNSLFTINKPSGVATLATNFANSSQHFTITSGTLNLGGYNLTGVNTLTVAAAGTLQLYGAETVTATTKTLQAGSTVTYTGDGDTAADSYTISTFATTYPGLRINSTDGTTDTFSLGANVSVTGVLTLSAGNVTTAANTLIMTSTGSVVRSSGHIVGNLQKNVAVGANVLRVFEVGTGADYTPVTVTFASVSVAGTLTVTSTAGEHGNVATSGLDANQDVNRYFTLTNSGATFTTYSATFEYVAADVDVGADPTTFEVTNYTGGAWSPATEGARTATSAEATGLTTFGAFAIGALPPIPPVGGFNAYETATAGGAISGVIKTKVGASAFNLSVIALNVAKDAIQTAFTGEVKVELLNGSDNSGTLDANGCNSSWTVIQTISNPTFVGGDSGRKTAGFTENNVWTNARIRISYPATGAATAIGCSNDNFAIRPSSLTVSITDGDSTTVGTTRALTNSAATGGVVHKAGQPFTVTAAAPAAATNYAGSASIKSQPCALPAGCVNGTLAIGAYAGAGTRTASATYSEAGTFDLELEDAGFAAVDAADGSTAVERTIAQAGGAATIGRFIPNNFVLTVANSPTFKTFNSACGSRSFTYIGQSFGFVGTAPQVLITARNSAGVITTNYKSTLWKMVAGGVTRTYASAQTLATSLAGPVVSSSEDGTGTITMNAADLLTFTRTTPVAPFTAVISLTVDAVDTSENAVGGNGTISATAAAVFNPLAFDSGDAMRFGRLRLTNGNGSELTAMPIGLETQYFNGSGFVTNTADNCTTIAPTAIVMNGYQKNLIACETSVSMSGALVAGKGNLKLSTPGKYNNGSVNLAVNLTAVAAGSTCIAGAAQAATAVDLTHLQGSWTGASYDQNPAARATFGLYRNSEKFVYMRENF